MKKISSKIKENLCLYGLLLFGFLLRIFYIFSFTKPESYLWSDPGGYDQRALQFAQDQYVMFSTYWPPFFHLFLSVIYRPLVWLGLEGQRIKIDIIFFAILYMVGFWCIYQIVKKLFSVKPALVVLTILIFWYPFIFLNYLVMSENLFFPLAFLGLYFLIVKPLKPSTGLWLGLFWGLALLSRPIFALVIPLFIIWGIYNKLGWRFLLKFAIVIFIIIGLMMAFNFYYTKGAEKSISSNGGVGFALLWCDAKSIEFNNNGYNFGFGPPANIKYPDSKKIVTGVPFENQNYYYEMGINCIKNNPERLFTNTSSIIKLFHSRLFPTTTDVAFWEGFRLFFKFLSGFLFLASLATIIGIKTNLIKLESSIKKYFYLFGLFIFSLFTTVYLQNPGEERYIIPYSPLLIILSIPFFNSLSKLKKYYEKYFYYNTSL